MTETAQHEEPAGRCSRCRAELRPEQDWCLECGTAATTRVVAPPGWRVPVAVVLGVVLVFGAVLAIALTALSKDADRAVPAAPASASAPAAGSKAGSDERAAKKGRRPGTTGSSGASGATGATGTQGGVPLWPDGKDAYSVILLTTTDRAGAEKMARDLNRQGGEAGILSSADFEFFGPGQWIVWSGSYQDKADAVKAAAAQAKDGRNGYVTLVKHKS